jgi:hypothetical protein
MAATAAVATLLWASTGYGQEPRPAVDAAYLPDGDLARVVTSWGRKGKATLQVGGAKAVTLHQGEASGCVVVGHGRGLVALAIEHPTRPFLVIPIADGKPGKAVALERPTKRKDIPFAVAATVTPSGFSLFYQEVQTDDPSAAHTYLVRLDDQGQPDGPATEIAVPWSLAAAAWNGKGYHLALYYPGDQRGMRLSMVSLSAAGQPEQHPDWASAPGYIADVHLHAIGTTIRAFYRGGSGGDRLLESDVTAIRSWGSEPPKARDHGALAGHQAIAVSKKGKPTRVTGARLR